MPETERRPPAAMSSVSASMPLAQASLWAWPLGKHRLQQDPPPARAGRHEACRQANAIAWISNVAGRSGWTSADPGGHGIGTGEKSTGPSTAMVGRPASWLRNSKPLAVSRETWKATGSSAACGTRHRNRPSCPIASPMYATVSMDKSRSPCSVHTLYYSCTPDSRPLHPPGGRSTGARFPRAPRPCTAWQSRRESRTWHGPP